MVVCSFNLFRRHFYVYDIKNQDLSLVRLYLFHLSVKSRILSCWRRYKVRPCDVTVTFFTCSSLVYVYLLAPAISPHVPQLFPLSSHVHVQRESQGLQINRQSSKNPICPPPIPRRLWLGHWAVPQNFVVLCPPLLWFPHAPRWLSPGSIICSDSHCFCLHTRRKSFSGATVWGRNILAVVLTHTQGRKRQRGDS